MAALTSSPVTTTTVRPEELGAYLDIRALEKAATPLDLNRQLREGLPYSALRSLRRAGYTIDEIARVTANSERTVLRRLTGRSHAKRLNLATSDRVVRLARISILAERLIGTREKALQWLRTQNRYLGDVTPMEMLETEAGTEAVQQSLFSVAFGGIA